MALKTPPYRCTGIYKLIEPWSAKPTHIYTCVAIRKFSELISRGDDVWLHFYYPKQLQRSIFESDKAQGASIVTLLSEHGETIDVPDSYIESYPETNLANYKHIVLSCSLGALPEDTDLSFIISKVTSAVAGALGREPSVNTHVGATTNPLTVSEAEVAETVRDNAIQERQTEYASIQSFEKKYTDVLAAYLEIKDVLSNKEKELEKAKANADASVLEEKSKLEKRLAEQTSLATQATVDKANALAEQKKEFEKQQKKADYLAKTRERLLMEEIEQLKQAIATSLTADDLPQDSELVLQLTQKKKESIKEAEVGSDEWKAELEAKLKAAEEAAESKYSE